VSIGEDGRAGAALELAIISLSSTSSSLIPEMRFLSVMHKKSTEAMALVGPQFIFIGIRHSFLAEK
jgi:hypothetical protein